MIINGLYYFKYMEEIWKDIPTYDGFYQVSNFGNVKSLKCNKQKILKAGLNSCGYYQVVLCKNVHMKNMKVHKLVAMAFLNHLPNGMNTIIDHINNDKLDNRLENLQIISQRENSSKDRKSGSSQYTGVSWFKRYNKWRSKIKINGKSKHLGYFTNELLAHKAYQHALKNI
jgi:hypothetical protein